MKGFYPGIGISVFGLIPAMSLYFTTYEYSKKILKNNYKLNVYLFFKLRMEFVFLALE